jgi:hypothetical protein
MNTNTSQAKAGEQTFKLTEAAKRAAEGNGLGSDAARTAGDWAADARQQATKHTTDSFAKSVEAFSNQAREAGAWMNRTLGFSGEDAERLTERAKQNMEAVTRGSTILTQAFQDMSRSWIELAQNQWQRNLDGMNRLTRSKSVQDFTTIHSELIREGLQHTIEDSRALAETSLRAVNDAGKTFEVISPTNTARAAA